MNAKLRGLLARKEKLVGELKAINDCPQGEGGSLSQAQEGNFNLMMSELKGLNADIERERALADEAQTAPSISSTFAQHSRPQRPILSMVPGASQKTFASVFNAQVAGHEPDPFRGSVAAQIEAVIRASVDGVADPRLGEIRAAAGTSSGSDPSSGGFAFPRSVTPMIWDEILGTSDVLSLVDTTPLLTGLHSYPVFDGQDRSAGGQGAITTEWVSEYGSFTAQKALLREVELQPKKAGSLISVSNELLADAPRFETQLRQALISNGQRSLEEMVVRGEGGQQPLGILNSPSLISITRTASFYDDVLSLYQKNFNRGRAVWLVHSTVIPTLFKLNFVGDTAASDLQPTVFNQRADGTMTLLGRPLIVTDAMNALTAAGDIAFVDLMSYLLGLRQALEVKASSHVYFESDRLAVRSIVRADGAPKYSETITERDGSTTVSWAVTIAA